MENFRVVLRSRPGVNGEPMESNFGYESFPFPSKDLQDDQLLIKTLYLSVEPAMRCCMNDSTGTDYLSSWQLDETVYGSGLGVVISSKSDKFKEKDIVCQFMHWPFELYFKSTANNMYKVDKNVTGNRISLALSCLGLIGLTSLIGIKEKGHIIRGANETFVVSGAAGACGTLAGQIARLEGCGKVIGLCGTEEKCHFLQHELGFDESINYKLPDFKEQLQNVCPSGVDIYFDNVGGEVSNAVIELMNPKGRIILCGQISQYNKDVPYPPPLPKGIEDMLREKEIKRDRFLILNYPEKHNEGLQQLGTWIKTGQLKVRETIEEGLENAGKAFVNMMRGGNIGKQLVHVADP